MLLSSAVITAGVLTACGGDDESSAPPNTGAQSPAIETPDTTSPTTPQPAGPEIVITDYAFAVPPSVKPGERITLRNNADGAHSVTANQGNLFDVRVSGGGGISTLVAPTAPGTYPFHCKYHAGMVGTLTVQ
jgi:plastocyanin